MFLCSLAHLVSYWFPITAWFVDTATDRIPKREWDRHFHGLGLCVGWHTKKKKETKRKRDSSRGTLTCLVVGYYSLLPCSLAARLYYYYKRDTSRYSFSRATCLGANKKSIRCGSKRENLEGRRRFIALPFSPTRFSVFEKRKKKFFSTSSSSFPKVK